MSEENEEQKSKIEPYLPRYSRPPNKFLRYELRDFDDGHGNGGQYRVAHFLDKKGKEQEMTAHVIWKFGWYAGVTEEEYKKGLK